MNKMEIYEPAMCCSTGLCGPSIDPELLRVSTILSHVQKRGIKVKRFNLTSEPQAFISNESIHKLIAKDGPDILPVTVVDGTVVKTKGYPTNEEFTKWLGVPVESNADKTKHGSCDCGPGGCC